MLAWLVVYALLASSSSDAGRSVCLLQSSHWQRAEAALLYALRIYTRDLKTPITISKVPSRTEPRGDVQAGAQLGCASGATLVIWFSGQPSAAELWVLRCAAGSEYRLPLQPAKDLDIAAQTLALKIRGLLTEATPSEAGDFPSSAVSQDGAQTQAKPTPQGVAPEAGTEDPVGGDDAATAESDAGRLDDEGGQLEEPRTTERKLRLEGGLEWTFGAASAFSGYRQGLLLRLALESTKLPLALELDGALVTSVVSDVARYHLSVSEIPVGVTLSARLTRSWWALACGPRVSVHRVQSDGVTPEGHAARATNYSAGLGLLEHASLRASEVVSFVLSLSTELLLPAQQFSLGGKNGPDAGPFQWTLSVGVAVRP